LTIEPPDHTSEREADHVARQVVAPSEARRIAQPISLLPSTQRRIQRQPTFSEECSAFHRCSVIEPLVHSKQMVDAVLKELPSIADGSVTTGRIIDLLNVHFHTATAANVTVILDRFKRIRAELNARVRYVCHKDEPADCESTGTGFVGGFTACGAGQDIHLCAPYYVSLPCPEQARVLVHENAHHVPELCNDYAYVGQANYMTLPAEQAMGNPDTYAQFAKMVFMGTPSCIDCGEEVQRRGGKRY
jgi:hypothetical protein